MYVQEVSVKQLAESIGITYGYMRSILCGRFSGTRVRSKINATLGIKEETDEKKRHS